MSAADGILDRPLGTGVVAMTYQPRLAHGVSRRLRLFAGSSLYGGLGPSMPFPKIPGPSCYQTPDGCCYAS